MVEKQARVDVIRKIDQELQSALLHDELRVPLINTLVLRRPALPIAMLQKDPLARHVQHVGRRARHQVEPIGMLSRRAIVRPGKFGKMQRVFVAIDHQRHIRHIALVQPVAGDAALRRPAAKVACAIPQPIGKLFGLPLGLLPAARRTRDRSLALRDGDTYRAEASSAVSMARRVELLN